MLFSIDKMVDIMDIYQSLSMSIGTLMKNPEMLNLFLIILKLKKMCKDAVKKLPYLIRYGPDQYKFQQIIKLF